MAVTQRNTALLQRTLESNRRATYSQGPQRGGPYLEWDRREGVSGTVMMEWMESRTSSVREMGRGSGEGREKEEGRSEVMDRWLGHPGVWRTGGGLPDISHCLDSRSARSPTLFLFLRGLVFTCPSDTPSVGSPSRGCRSRHHSNPLAVARVTTLQYKQ